MAVDFERNKKGALYGLLFSQILTVAGRIYTKSLKSYDFRLFGGDKRDRTADLLTASQALSQLSYTPTYHIQFSLVEISGIEPLTS